MSAFSFLSGTWCGLWRGELRELGKHAPQKRNRKLGTTEQPQVGITGLGAGRPKYYMKHLAPYLIYSKH